MGSALTGSADSARVVPMCWRQNDLAADDDLVHLAAQALAKDERTRRETIFAAESWCHPERPMCSSKGLRLPRSAGQVPSVRASNYIERWVRRRPQNDVQPSIAKKFEAICRWGVKQVIINHNRRGRPRRGGQLPDR
jgi:hypothetical protein